MEAGRWQLLLRPVTGHALATSVFGIYAQESIKYSLKTYITHIRKHQNVHLAASR